MPKKYDSRPETTAQIDFSTYYRKEFRLVLDNFIESLRDNLENTLSEFRPLEEIFKMPLDRQNCTLEKIISIQKLFPFIAKDEDIESWQTEIEILLDTCSRANCQNFDDINKVAFKLKNAIPRAFKIIHLILVAPISSASSERSFSKFKFVFSPLRTLGEDERVNWLMHLSTAKDIVDKIDLQNIVDEWSILKNRRIKL